MPNYTRARSAYLDWYSHLLSSPDTDTGTDSSRGVGEITLGLMADRVEGLNLASEELTHVTQPYLESNDHAHRIAALDSLLHQIEGDLEVANVLWSIIDRVEEDGDDAPVTITESVRGHQLAQALRRLSAEMPVNIEATSAQNARGIRSTAARRPPTLEASLEDLRFEIHDTVDVIADRANNVGIRLARDIVTTGIANWAVVVQAINLLQGHEKAGDIGWGLEDEVKEVVGELAGSLRALLVNVIEKVLIVIEKNDLVRYTIADWLEQLRDTSSEKRKDRFATLVEQLYQTDPFLNHDLAIWLQDGVDIDHIHDAADRIMRLGNDFDRLANQTRRLSSVIAAGTLFSNPLLTSVGFALQIGLLGTLVFAGYDHLDEGARALNITAGVKEVLITYLPVSPQTIERADALRRGAIRLDR